ncbi:MAG: Asp-tRNA(Asn)/Glu-tRNA(Gln) amidotransferase subunit GatB [Planctomycetes bacterium]|nr:Asp-tRNA(Asn)/Glu-tRNA(Gln) amidotransferase subunit GatB [Planctomycetota bacterium]
MREGLEWVSQATGTRWVAVIGLEVHAQLSTRTKLFCGCAYEFGAEPNTRVCPVCTGQPGSLPVLNAEALELAVRAALALGCEVAPRSKFDRKNYFYCDLPKNYQITQYDRPYCSGGGIDLDSGRRVRLERIHVEEDAGKAIHDRGDATLVDFNRAGVPLIESVTHADLCCPEDAGAYLAALREILVYVGASSADMEKGELRCDVNVSVHPAGEPWRTKVEVKNLNSFSNVEASIEYEIARQVAAWESSDPADHPVQETRLWDAGANRTRTMRKKEGEADYRYFPEPDLPPVSVTPALLEATRALLPELPAARRARYQRELGLSAYDAGVLTAARDVADFFEAAARLSGAPKDACNWITNEVLRALSGDEVAATSVDELPMKPHDLSELIALVRGGTLSASAARQVVRAMMQSGKAAGELVVELGLEQVQDDGELERWCREALAGREAIAAQVREGHEKALGALMGPVMQASKGKANPQKVREILLRLIQEG